VAASGTTGPNGTCLDQDDRKGSGKKTDLTGQTFGRLRVMGEAPSRKGKRYWLCSCECGKQTEVRQDNLLRWRTGSCGCRQHETAPSGPRTRLPKALIEASRLAKDTGDFGPLVAYYAQQGQSVPEGTAERLRATWGAFRERSHADAG
jgi:hypothetical protein